MTDLRPVVERVLERRRRAPAAQSLLVALSGIDGAGKGYLGEQLDAALRGRGLNAVLITIDPWLNLPSVRFSDERPAEHFYANAIRFDEMFEKLVLPLKQDRSVRVEAGFAEETSTEFRRHTYEFNDVDVIVLEGIYLLRRDLRRHYDLSIWIECSFETALERALRRGQEGLPPAETIRAYQTIYFPAQLIHFALDEPWAAADLVISNDPLLTVPDATANPWYLPAARPAMTLEMT
ncbi:MAG TPA: uridine kinase [Candidatus Xenobia bacterium]|nr:uridine kinase [Candidatus Xenobia bacterium]